MKDANSYRTKSNKIVLELFDCSRTVAKLLIVSKQISEWCVCDGDVSSSSRPNPAAAASVVLWDSGNT